MRTFILYSLVECFQVVIYVFIISLNENQQNPTQVICAHKCGQKDSFERSSSTSFLINSPHAFLQFFASLPPNPLSWLTRTSF